MKKSIFIICLITAFFFLGINEVAAQWSVTVEWDDTECDCGTITKKSIFIKITYILTQQVIVNNREFDIMGETPPYETTGTETILRDCEDCYLVQARVVYYDPYPSECCSGNESDIVDGQDLIDGVFLDEILMYLC